MARSGPYLAARLQSGFKAWLFVVKLSVPALFLTRLLLYFDLIGPVASVFEPLMALVGLPAEVALVWVSGMLGNIYVAVGVFLSLAPGLENFSVSQASTLGCLILLAHSLPVEGQVCRGVGLSFWRVTLFRIFSALLLGVLIKLSTLSFGWGQEPAEILGVLGVSTDAVPPWDQWFLSLIRQFLMMLVVVLGLMLLMDLIRLVGLTRLFMVILGPPLRLAGIGAPPDGAAGPRPRNESVLMVTVIGCVLGLSLGGGLIAAESRTGHIAPRDIFGAMMLMTVFHSLFEDTLVVWSIGGSLWCLLAARTVFGLGLTSLVTRLARRPRWRKILVGDGIDWEAPAALEAAGKY